MKYSFERHCIENAIQEIKRLYLNKEQRKMAHHYDKGVKDVVTDIDLNVEKYIINVIKENFPTATIVSEEFNTNAVPSGLTFTVDPIDGTMNFARNSTIFGFQIAMLDEVKPLLSYIYLFDLDQLFMAVDGEGSYLNGERYTVNKDYTLKNSLVSLGSFSNINKPLCDFEFRLLQEVQAGVMGVRMFGCGSYDLSAVSCGITQAHIMNATHIWDVAPGYLIAKEAGCVTTQIDGKPFDLMSKSYLFACNEELSNFIIKCANSVEN